VEDAVAAVDAGADAIGMVLQPGMGRCVDIDEAQRIAAAAPAFVSVIGLFVDSDSHTISRCRKRLPLSAIQLHGSESPELIAGWKPFPFIKALHVDAEIESTLREWKAKIAELDLSNLTGILLETGGHGPGGTGMANNWAALRQLQEIGALKGLPPLIAAGGLTPANVADVVRLLRPYAVDVSSGVETKHREKSPEKIAAFIQAVRDADRSAG
jgi:phosphoribosylanthranilate isomerase